MQKEKLTVQITAKIRDFFGVWEVHTLVNTKQYLFWLNSDFKVEQVEKLLRLHKPGMALNFLKQNNLEYHNV